MSPARAVAALLAVVAASAAEPPPASAPLHAPPLAPPLPPHPRLVLPDAALAALRARILAGGPIQTAYAAVLAHGRQLLGTTVVPYPNCTVVGACRNAAVFGAGANYVNANGARDAIQTCALLHRLGIDNASASVGAASVWSARALLELDNIASFPSWYWPVGEALERAGLAYAAAIGYDWLFDLLDSAQRAAVEGAIGRLALHTRENDELETMWWTQDVYNWNVNAQAPLLAATLAVADVPAWAELASRVQGYVLASVPRAIATFAPDGVWPESPAYQSYALSELVHGAAALVSATGSDAGLLGGPGVCGAGLVNIFNTGPSLNVFNRGDSGAGHPSPEVLFYLSARCSLPALAAFARILTGSGGDSDSLVWWSDAGAPADMLALPTAQAFADPSLDRSRGAKTHFVSLREAWLQPNASWVAAKGGDNYFDDGGSVSHNNHGHLDVGSFVLESDGVRWAVDLGGGAYDYPLLAYFGRFRFGYAFTSSVTHNVLSFDDVTQNRRGQGRVAATSAAVAVAGAGREAEAAAAAAAAAGAPAWAALDLTSAYGGALLVVRNVSLAGRVTTIADSWTHPRAAQAFFRFATTAAVALDGAAMTLTDAASGATLHVAAAALGGAPLAWAAPELRLPTPQTSTYGGLPVYMCEVAVPAAQGGVTVVFTPGA